MVIQRLQTLYLLLMAIVLLAFSFLSSVNVTADNITYLFNVLGLTIKYNADVELLNGIISYLAPVLFAVTIACVVTTIFKYKNLKAQMRWCVWSGILTVISTAVHAAVLQKAIAQLENVTSISYQWTWALPVVALVLCVMAYCGMNSDRKLLRSYDRLR